MIWVSPEARLVNARKCGDVAYCKEVCIIADKADSLMSSGKTAKALRLYRVIADLDMDDKLISEVVNHSRRVLEVYGATSPPSIGREYQQYLDSLPPHDRHVMLARQVLRQLAAARQEDDRPMLIAQAINLLEEAQKSKPLGKKDQRVLMGLKSQQT